MHRERQTMQRLGMIRAIALAFCLTMIAINAVQCVAEPWCSTTVVNGVCRP